MVLYPGEETDGMAEPAGYRRIRTPRAGLYRYRVLNGDAVDVRSTFSEWIGRADGGMD